MVNIWTCYMACLLVIYIIFNILSLLSGLRIFFSCYLWCCDFNWEKWMRFDCEMQITHKKQIDYSTIMTMHSSKQMDNLWIFHITTDDAIENVKAAVGEERHILIAVRPTKKDADLAPNTHPSCKYKTRDERKRYLVDDYPRVIAIEMWFSQRNVIISKRYGDRTLWWADKSTGSDAVYAWRIPWSGGGRYRPHFSIA